MRKVIGFLGSYMFFYLGNWTSILMEKTDWESLYPLYKGFMNWSLNLQYWAELDRPWRDPTEKDK